MIVPLVLLCAACFACGLILGVIAMSVATAMTEQERLKPLREIFWPEDVLGKRLAESLDRQRILIEEIRELDRRIAEDDA